jgi:ABC-type branched-subunit amino acid transport system ATPase component
VASKDAVSLSLGDRRFLEIAKSICGSPWIVLLDEPASGLALGEVDQLAGVVRSFAKMGAIVLLIEHNFPFVTSVADQVYVLDVGAVIASGPPATIREDARVIESYLGRVSTKEEVGSRAMSDGDRDS